MSYRLFCWVTGLLALATIVLTGWLIVEVARL